jgi:hypothetical protein
MRSRKAKRKSRQRTQQAANRLRQRERPRLHWLQRKAKAAVWRSRRAWRISWRYLRATWKVFAFVVIVIATVLGLYEVLLPRLSVSQIEPLNPSDPFTARLTIRNSGYFSVYNVEVKCVEHDVTTERRATMRGFTIIPGSDRSFAEIAPDQSATVYCPVSGVFAFESPVKKADMEFIFDYRPEYLFWRRTSRFRFVTVRTSDGTLRWIEQPPLQK